MDRRILLSRFLVVVAFLSPSLTQAEIRHADVGSASEFHPLDHAGKVRTENSGLDVGAYHRTVVPCQPGNVSANGQEPCVPCSPGTVQPNAGQTQCLICGPGTFADLPGSTICLECPPGTFRSTPGGSSCQSCNCEDNNGCTENNCNAVSGACQFDEVCVVPAMSQWGIVVLLLLMGIAGTITVGRTGTAVV